MFQSHTSKLGAKLLSLFVRELLMIFGKTFSLLSLQIEIPISIKITKFIFVSRKRLIE